MRFLLRRGGFYALAAWVSLTLNFLLPHIMPGDPASAIYARFQGRIRPEELQALKEAYGVSDAPLFDQYIGYFTHAIRGDLGLSISNFPAPVTDVISTSLVWTLLLGGT